MPETEYKHPSICLYHSTYHSKEKVQFNLKLLKQGLEKRGMNINPEMTWTVVVSSVDKRHFKD